MTTRSHIAHVAIAIILAGVAAAPVYAGSGRPPEMTPQQYKAMVVRSEALNALYGLGKPAQMTHAEYRAALIRGAALNERYGLPVALSSAELARIYGTRLAESPLPEAPAPPTVTAGDGFDWTDAMIGAGFIAGLFSLGTAGALIVRRHGSIGHPHH
jgi:hypothetical protein